MMINIQWANSKWHVAFLDQGITMCGIPIPSGSEGPDRIFDFSGDPPTCKRCLASIAAARSERELDEGKQR